MLVAMKLASDTELRLLVLLTREQNGRELAAAFRKSTGKGLSYGTLYTALRRLRERGWVSMREGSDDDGRIRWFRITGSGTRAVDAAREHHLELANFGLRTEASA